MEFMFDWDGEGDRFSFEDSDRFEDDSICSWISEAESLCNNWRGWRKQNSGGGGGGGGGAAVVTNSHLLVSNSRKDYDNNVTSLVELSAQAVACHIPFEVVERFFPPIPEQLQLRIAFWSFPENEEDIRLYSCLANGSADEFQKGEVLFKSKCVTNALQIGFHLSATVVPSNNFNLGKGSYGVALIFDRRHITSCSCTCSGTSSWCAHIVALCLFRIHQSSDVCLRAPVSESLSRLERDQLQKFAQYLISELPQQILPTAQRLLDELLSSQQAAINTVCGAPDPTAGPSASEQMTWCLDEVGLHENIKKTLVKFCVPSPMVLSDVNYLSNNAPPAATEWQALLRPLRGREPEGIWNLLSIVREMFRRNDGNAIPLLEILTEELLACEQILIWWFINKMQSGSVTYLSRSGGGGGGNNGSQTSLSSTSHAASSLCDEIVTLWRLAALNPSLSSLDRDSLCAQLKRWHVLCVDKLRKSRSSAAAGGNEPAPSQQQQQDIEQFPGFKAAVEACQLCWGDYLIPGVNYIPRYFNSRGVLLGKHEGGGGGGGGDRKVAHAKDYGISQVSCTRKAITVSSREAGGGEDTEEGAVGLQQPRGSSVTKQPIGAAGGGSQGFNRAAGPAGEPSFARRSERGFLLARQSRGVAAAAVLPEGMLSDSESIASNAATCGGSPEARARNERLVRNITEELRQSFLGPTGAALGPAPIQVVMGPSAESQALAAAAGAAAGAAAAVASGPKEDCDYFVDLKKLDNQQDIMFALAEALHAHGHVREASKLARQLAEEMLATPIEPAVEQPQPAVKGHKKKKCLSYTTSFAGSTLAKASFLCLVLLEDPECRHLAFRIGLFGLEMPRPPAISKSLEVKLAYQESELVVQLKRMTLGAVELAIIRDRARMLRDGRLQARGGDTLLPISLAGFVFDILCQPNARVAGAGSGVGRGGGHSSHQTKPPDEDEKLGFETAIAALGLKANISEAEHPLLCEGTRRQRGELIVSLLLCYKDDHIKLSMIMNQVLDKEIHQLFKDEAGSCYFIATTSPVDPVSAEGQKPEASSDADAASGAVNVETKLPEDSKVGSVEEGAGAQAAAAAAQQGKLSKKATVRVEAVDREAEEDDTDCRLWEAKFRCTTLKTPKKHSVGMASIDSSAPETTSSDNSPTLVRRAVVASALPAGHHGNHGGGGGGPGSDSGSSHNSSGSNSSGCIASSSRRQFKDSQENVTEPVYTAVQPLGIADWSCSTPGSTRLPGRYRGRSHATPVIPNHPSEASAHFMFELAKTVLVKAGGTSSTSLFVNQPAGASNNNASGPHRALHLCAFHIGLYALGLNNCVSPNWLSRTYSSHVSWITGQAVEIGYSAIKVLINTWDCHLTPQEVASLADRASRCRDPNMVKVAAELALSTLPLTQALNPNEIQRVLVQCKEQSREMLERACLSVEMAAKGGGVYPGVLFDIARKWYELYEESLQGFVPSGPADDPSRKPIEPANVLQLPFAQQQQQQQQQLADQAVGGAAVAPCLPLVAPPRGANCPQTVQRFPQQIHYAMPPPQQAYSLSQFVPPPQQYTVLQPLPPPHAGFPQYYSVQTLPLQLQPVQQLQMIHQGPAQQQPPQGMHVPRNPYFLPPPMSVSAPMYPAPNMAAAVPPHGQVAYQFSASHPAGGKVPPPPPGGNWNVGAMGGGGGAFKPPNEGVPVFLPAPPVPPPAPTPPQQGGNLAGGSAAIAPADRNQLTQMNYVLAAYRVGMLAMETLARRVHDDRAQIKYAKNPPYGEDVKWLHNIALKLGTTYLQQFCLSAVNTVVSPFLLFDLAIESANFLACNNANQVSQQIRLPMVSSLLQRSLQMFVQCTHARIYHILPSDYDEFVNIVCCARNAFCMAPGGMVQFNEMIQGLRRSKNCKKELWQRIIQGLHGTNSV